MWGLRPIPVGEGGLRSIPVEEGGLGVHFVVSSKSMVLASESCPTCCLGFYRTSSTLLATEMVDESR